MEFAERYNRLMANLDALEMNAMFPSATNQQAVFDTHTYAREILGFVAEEFKGRDTGEESP